MAAFHAHQGAAIASAGVTTAKMALDAYAAALELGAPGLVLAPIAAGAAVATGGHGADRRQSRLRENCRSQAASPTRGIEGLGPA